MNEYTGNMHIHSSYSDGSLEIEDIAAKASRAGLDFIIITDHYTLAGRYAGKEGYQQKVLVLIGMEANETKNHYLCLDIGKEVKNKNDNPQVVIDEVNRQHGIGIIAHPFEKGSPLFADGISFEWTDWKVSGFQGIEIWNFTSQWKDHVTSTIKGLWLVFYPHAALSGPCPKALAKLDEYQCRGEKIIATGGSDAHGYAMKLGMFHFQVSPYETSFKCINVHVLTELPLTGEVERDKEKIYTALRKGTLWIGYDYFINSRGFRYFAREVDQTWQMGDTVPSSKDLTLQVSTPAAVRVKLLKNGKVIQSSSGKRHIFSHIDPGVYRIEAYHRHFLGYRPWIFSNSIWVE
ncbi:hypothetical protein ASZ90_018986 [hydrocarbon metagenome]|uniref:Polymerase/histidinol phosphatase N-terminal domain-containing protein n=1 Tax=hydrocarbon metagenome TaxID=938273 RepID=A0A0W8E573_9ZZZZ